ATASGPPPAAVGELAKGVAVNGAFNKIALALATVVVVALGAGVGLLGTSAASQPEKPVAPVADEKAKEQPKAVPAPPAAKEVTATGRVLNPDGKPLAGAKLFMHRVEGLLELGATGADGKFTVKAPVPAGHFSVWLIARAEGVGMDFPFIPVDQL